MSGDEDRRAARRALEKVGRGWKAPAPKQGPSEEEQARIAAEGLIDLSLGLPYWVTTVLSIVLGFGWVIAGIFVSSAIVGDVNLLSVVLLFAIFAGGFAGSLMFVAGPVARALARRQKRWLDALPVPFDRAAYLRALGVERQFSSTVRITIAPRGKLDDDARALLRRAGARACWHNQAVWSGDALVVTSRDLTTSHSGGRGSGTYYNNHAVHRWFRKAARRFLVPAARAYDLAGVTVEIR